MTIPNIWKNKNCSKPPTSCVIYPDHEKLQLHNPLLVLSRRTSITATRRGSEESIPAGPKFLLIGTDPGKNDQTLAE